MEEKDHKEEERVKQKSELNETEILKSSEDNFLNLKSFCKLQYTTP